MRSAANGVPNTQAKTAPYFSANYNVTILDASSAATRLTSVNGLNPAQVADMKDFTPTELAALELALETLSDPLLKLLEGAAFARQKVQIEDKGAGATPRFMVTTKHDGVTHSRAHTANDRTIILFDGYHNPDDVSFVGSTDKSILPYQDFVHLHEIGHALDYVISARAAFNRRFPTLRGFTDYARGDRTAEAFEEAFVIFQGDPQWLQTNHKDVFDWFTTFASTGHTP
ncbi:MAG: hypothetical protein QOC62_6537 [Mycobacterium sp.]|nr:hypothetical protein [Mycobacterium sp.]